MYYTHPCTYCKKTFYAWHSTKEGASSILYYGIKKHLMDYGEDHKEFELDDAPEIEINDIYKAAIEMNDRPAGGYPA